MWKTASTTVGTVRSPIVNSGNPWLLSTWRLPVDDSPTTMGHCPALRLHPQLPKQKRINVRPVFNLLGNRLALAVSGLAVDAQQYRTLFALPVRGFGLHQRCHLLRVHGIDAAVAVRRHEHDCRIFRARL